MCDPAEVGGRSEGEISRLLGLHLVVKPARTEIVAAY